MTEDTGFTGVKVTVKRGADRSEYDRRAWAELEIGLSEEQLKQHHAEVEAELKGVMEQELPKGIDRGVIAKMIRRMEEDRHDPEFSQNLRTACIRHEYGHLEIDLLRLANPDLRYIKDFHPRYFHKAAINRRKEDLVTLAKIGRNNRKLEMLEEIRTIIAESRHESRPKEKKIRPNATSLSSRVGELLVFSVGQEYKNDFAKLGSTGYISHPYQVAMVYLLLKNDSLLVDGSIDLSLEELRRQIGLRAAEYLQDSDIFIEEINRPEFVQNIDEKITECQQYIEDTVRNLGDKDREALLAEVEKVRSAKGKENEER